MIEAKHLRKSYGPTQAVRDLSFMVNRGEIVGLLGPNGAGKSTTIRMMTTYLVPDGGEIVIDGHDVELEAMAVRRMLGYMPEASALYADMKALDYLRFVGRVRQIPREKIMTRIGWASERCGLQDILLKSIGALSKGNKQRVALAQAILHDPEVLVLDEPTSGLDPNQIRAIRRFIRELGQEKTVFLSTHILQEVTALCSRAIIVNRGQVIADGSLDQLVEQATEDNTVTVALGGAEAAEIEAGLRTVEGIDGVELASPGRWNVAGGPETPGRLFELARDKGWSLTELSPRRPTIEEVFHNLTEDVGSLDAGADARPQPVAVEG